MMLERKLKELEYEQLIGIIQDEYDDVARDYFVDYDNEDQHWETVMYKATKEALVDFIMDRFSYEGYGENANLDKLEEIESLCSYIDDDGEDEDDD